MTTTGFTVHGSGPAVVLLHSSLSSGLQWQALLKQLSPHFCCINIDLLGYGGAPSVSCANSYQLTTEVERVIDIIDSVIGQQTFAIVGHSFGGAVGLRLAYELKTRASAMVLYEPVAFHLLDKQSEAFKEIMQMAEPLAGLLAQNKPEVGAQIFVDYWNGEGFYLRLPARVQQVFSQNMAKVLLDFQALINEPCTFAGYQQIDCPTLVLEGESSRLSAKTLAQLLTEALPKGRHQVFDGGHMAPVSDSMAVAGVIGGFLCEVLLLL